MTEEELRRQEEQDLKILKITDTTHFGGTAIKVFVGTDVNGGCAECQMVFEYSLRKHSSRPVEIVWMKISEDPASFWHGWNTKDWSTPFSGFRYGIAEFCNYKGKAIYCDDDQLWLSDPVELWNTEIPDGKVMTGKLLPNGEVRHCVSLIDCEQWKDQVSVPVQRRKVNNTFVEMMKRITTPLTHIVGDEWNCYDGENMPIDQIKLLHMTDMATNPGVAMAVKRLGDQSQHWYNGRILEHRRPDVVDTFKQHYDEAIAAGYSVSDYISNKKVDYQMLDQSNYVANNGWDVRKGE